MKNLISSTSVHFRLLEETDCRAPNETRNWSGAQEALEVNKCQIVMKHTEKARIIIKTKSDGRIAHEKDVSVHNLVYFYPTVSLF